MGHSKIIAPVGVKKNIQFYVRNQFKSSCIDFEIYLDNFRRIMIEKAHVAYNIEM